MDRIRIGIVGCGKQAPKHISGYRNLPQVELVVADLDEDAARRLGEQADVPWSANPQQLFEDPEIAAVDICTPTGSHYPLIEQALAGGKHFFCEKPLCETIAEAEAIERAVVRSGLVGMVGYLYRFAPVFETAKRLLDPQERPLGEVTTALFRIGGRGSHQLWKHRRETGGGAVNEMLVHMLDLAIWFFGPPAATDVLCCELLRPERTIQGRTERVDAEDYVIVRLEMQNGTIIFCQADMLTPAFTQFVEIQGTNGGFMGSIQPDMPSHVFLHQPAGGFDSGKTRLSTAPVNLFEAQMAEFVRAVASGTQPSRGNVRDSLYLLQTLEQIRRRIAEK